MIYLIGGNGNLGSSIRMFYENQGVHILDRNIYKNWSEESSIESIQNYFEKDKNNLTSIFVASGLLDPQISFEDLVNVNFSLPKNIIDGVAGFGIRVVTFGSIMEHLSSDLNPYIKSKAMLSRYIQLSPSKTSHVTHFRLHTLYGGGEPKKFMFLGQIYSALKHRRTMRMTHGLVLREYHHIEDDLKAIDSILRTGPSGIHNLNHGKIRVVLMNT